MSAQPGRSLHNMLVLRLSLVAIAMFAFGIFAMPPLYGKFCEITGIGQAGIQTGAAPEGAAVGGRTVRVRFDATTNSGLNWAFRPLESSREVTLGLPADTRYHAQNLAAVSLAGRAVFNVTPPEAARYFVKTECFCFTRQVLGAGEQRDMPVYFYIREDLPEHIDELTLAYTFFRNDEPATAQAAP